MWVSTYPPITLYIHKTKHLIECLHNSLLYIGERETRESEIEKMDHEHKDSTITWADRKQEKKWERERDRRETMIHELKRQTNIPNGAKKRFG